MSLTVTESAIIDLQRQREATEMRARNFDPKAYATRDNNDMSLTPETIDNLTRPVRIVLTFEDPIKTRQQVHALQAALVELELLTQQHDLGINRQRLRMRECAKTAADTLVYLSGRTPTGKKKPGDR